MIDLTRVDGANPNESPVPFTCPKCGQIALAARYHRVCNPLLKEVHSLRAQLARVTAERDAALEHVRLLEGAAQTDEARLIAAADNACIIYAGCDTPDALAEEVVKLRDELAQWKVDTHRYSTIQSEKLDVAGQVIRDLTAERDAARAELAAARKWARAWKRIACAAWFWRKRDVLTTSGPTHWAQDNRNRTRQADTLLGRRLGAPR